MRNAPGSVHSRGCVFSRRFSLLTYGFANHYTAGLDYVGSFVFDWEKHIPFWPWTIVPYWTIDAFYGLSLFLLERIVFQA
ncbi:hypothetical protein LJC22_07540 [Desulfosarcina sp. OttesenSCG-928-G10]|nr:hypothetical protein [Desulfosarcina sp. OttesenSCG-928-G10]MDL2321708.1 hypothetical protein [Desulfosarcina sp. OttesenSCG-928-B08]